MEKRLPAKCDCRSLYVCPFVTLTVLRAYSGGVIRSRIDEILLEQRTGRCKKVFWNFLAKVLVFEISTIFCRY